MATRWTVLASGSNGNASLLECGDCAVLLDVGLGPRQLASRLREVGACPDAIRAVILTHTHADHWRARTLARLAQRGVRLYCHAAHRRELLLRCAGFQELAFAGLVETYEAGREFSPCRGVRALPVPVSHDGGPTFAFRLNGQCDLSGAEWAIGYATDLGLWSDLLVRHLCDADVLAIEFNHDVELQRASGRAPWLIERVLGDEGHLSNIQAAQLLCECLRRSQPGRVKHVVQLHLSRQCNRTVLAANAALDVIRRLELPIDVQTASQEQPTRTIRLGVDPMWQPAAAARAG